MRTPKIEDTTTKEISHFDKKAVLTRIEFLLSQLPLVRKFMKSKYAAVQSKEANNENP